MPCWLCEHRRERQRLGDSEEGNALGESLGELKDSLWTSFGTLYALVTVWVFGVLVAPEFESELWDYLFSAFELLHGLLTFSCHVYWNKRCEELLAFHEHFNRATVFEESRSVSISCC
eukprot:m.229058 g.229058  ORF g.229058 m.229058 type:complete len:118 (+) comp54257_c0_seq2:1239-1592(+)